MIASQREIVMRRTISHFLTSTRVGQIASALARRFAYREDGQAALEFGIVVVPFLALLFAIIETALVFWSGQVLETAVGDSARMIMTGQAQTLGLNANTYKSAVCAKIYGLFNCAGGLQIDIRTLQNWNPPPKPIDPNTGMLDTSGFTYQPGGPCDIVVARFVYKWPTFVRTFGLDVADLADGYRLMMATAAFRNEPYTVSAGC